MNYKFFMEKAIEEAKKALESGEFPVGCVVAYKNDIIVTGTRTGTSGNYTNEIDHAEMAALRCLSELKETVDKSKIILFCTLEPCLMCYSAIVLSDIGKIVYAYEDLMGGCTRCDLTKLSPFYKERKIKIIPDILRDKSMELFKVYFENQKNTYWKDSLLARYTLMQ
ncbi:MAG: nucleoside deaminase [Desulfobacteraceae bacterium]|nr:nucleoside deaminase [Desulfobacteraceae bacterium]MBC2718245.1 nucleoside deaminase [Desulfobacteraceae bacterium]